MFKREVTQHRFLSEGGAEWGGVHVFHHGTLSAAVKVVEILHRGIW